MEEIRRRVTNHVCVNQASPAITFMNEIIWLTDMKSGMLKVSSLTRFSCQIKSCKTKTSNPELSKI